MGEGVSIHSYVLLSPSEESLQFSNKDPAFSLFTDPHNQIADYFPISTLVTGT